MPDATLAQLHRLRAQAGPRTTMGLSDVVIGGFAVRDPSLVRAVSEAVEGAAVLAERAPDMLAGSEVDLCRWAQEGYVNFYAADAINPYLPVAARGPWIVTSHGAVVHDSGGYGMLGFGHAPDEVLATLARPWVVANIMTPSITHRRFADALQAELGHTRPGGSPFGRIVCMNSGSEAVTVAARIADTRAKTLTDPGGRHAGKAVKFLALEGGFHGRTDRPAHASDSSRPSYKRHLRTFRDATDDLVTVPPNDVEALRAAFAQAEHDDVYFEMMLIEPVMGEGRPGVAMSRAFYDAAHALTRQMGTLLLVDSIQAGLRAHGVLSVVDYPGFQDAPAPDLETWSKALNAAQYPLSVLGMTAEVAATYPPGIYGNTMTANPRALEVGIATLGLLTPEVRRNIVERGAELKATLQALAEELPGTITEVTGTGLLVAAHLDPATLPVLGDNGVERACRIAGLGVIHGGKNAIRMTPHFRITSAEITMMVGVLGNVLRARIEARHAAK